MPQRDKLGVSWLSPEVSPYLATTLRLELSPYFRDALNLTKGDVPPSPAVVGQPSSLPT